MRVALCFSGQLRNVRQTYALSYLPYILQPNAQCQIDTFVHSWYDKDVIGQTFMTAGGGVGSHPVPDNILQDMYELYNPVSVILQHQLPFDERNYNEHRYPAIVPRFTLSKMYSSWASNKLKSDHEQQFSFTYDVVVVARFDWIFHTPVLFDIVNQTGIYHPGCNPHGINVGYIMGSSASVDQYNQLFWEVQSVYDRGVSFCDEVLAEAYLSHKHIPIHNFNIPSTINRG